MKRKNSGISLLVALGISFAVLGIAIAILGSISRSLEQSTNLERSNQIFFSAESGIEAAFFHHNARGQGVHFPTAHETQVLEHTNAMTSVAWAINGRTEPIIGTIKEGGNIQIPLYWDGSENPSESPPLDGDGNFDPTHINASELNEVFELKFYDQVQDESGDDAEQAVFDILGEFQLPGGFDFGNDANEVLIDWSVSRQSASGWETFVPDKGSGVCEGDSEFVCEDELGSNPINSGQAIVGNVLPGGAEITLNTFLSENNTSMFTLSFRSLLPFEDEDLGKIEGIPFSLTTEGTSIPKDKYTVTATVETGDFSRTISLDVPEKTTIGTFDYVIFD